MTHPNQEIIKDIALPDVQRVDVVRSGRPFTRDSLLWEVIKDRSAAVSFTRYSAFIDNVFSGHRPDTVVPPAITAGSGSGSSSALQDRVDAIEQAQQILATSTDIDERDEAQRFLEDQASA